MGPVDELYPAFPPVPPEIEAKLLSRIKQLVEFKEYTAVPFPHGPPWPA